MQPGKTDLTAGRKTWRFSVRRFLAAVALLAISFLLLNGLSIERMPVQLAIPMIGCCWIGAWGLLRNGWPGLVVGASIGGLFWPILLTLAQLISFLEQPGHRPSVWVTAQASKKGHSVLDTKVDVGFAGVPLAEVVQALETMSAARILLDEARLSEQGVTGATAVHVEPVQAVSLGRALQLVLEPLRLSYAAHDDVLLITTPEGKHAAINPGLIHLYQYQPQERLRGFAPPQIPPYETADQFLKDLKDLEGFFMAHITATAGNEVGEAAVPGLVELLKHPNQETRVRAASALGLIGRRADIAVPALVDALDHCDQRFHAVTLGALGDFGPEAIEAAPVLLNALRDPLEPRPATAADSLWQITSDQRAIERLVELLRHQDPTTRSLAVGYLSRISPEHTTWALPALLVARHDSAPNVRSQILSMLVKRVSRREALELLSEVGDDSDPHVRANAASLLRSLSQSLDRA